MNWADYIILAVLALSVLIGLWRGLISEVLALAVWAAAFWVAWTFGPSVSGYFEHSIHLPSVRLLVGYGICFLTVLIAGALVRFLVSKLVEGTGLSGTDRLLGMVFGFARGVLLVTLAVFLLGFSAVTRDPWWQESVLLPQFKELAAWLDKQVPESVRQHLNPPAVLDHLPALPAAVPGATPAPEHRTHPAAATTAAPATTY
ncbi:CvpA family protein [Dyella solisilvae]|uniref:CvpA family protein n=1 Tax=Dyella solisilvae TaxID=1920168 RepID=A0A370K720_9GAMM|nr:CvpA family protein [Dyella solisilvae]RDI98257.1 CvpA family protein [Dyella solisilvae]